jgi:hypothetical protein
MRVHKPTEPILAIAIGAMLFLTPVLAWLIMWGIQYGR